MSKAWRPTAALPALTLRASILARIRNFFAGRGVLEVSTPVLGHSGPPDPHTALVEATLPGQSQRYYLQPSPESAMKRLLAAGSGPIYQIGPAFRALERGRRHNTEFTMLEWYRPGFSLEQLADEADALLAPLLGMSPATRVRYRDVFLEHVGIDPIECSDATLAVAAGRAGIEAPEGLDRDGLLDLLFSHRVEPELGPGIVQVFDFPASQAAMAVVEGAVARRVEVYVNGMELANGYLELTDPDEQERRFQAARSERRRRGDPVPPLDEALLAALRHGLPGAAGIALGVDRLVLLALGADSIDEVMAFPLERC